MKIKYRTHAFCITQMNMPLNCPYNRIACMNLKYDKERNVSALHNCKYLERISQDEFHCKAPTAIDYIKSLDEN